MEGGALRTWWETVEPLFQHMGPLGEAVKYVGIIVTAGWAIAALLGMNPLGPPVTRSERLAVGWLLCIASGVLLALLYIANARGAAGPDLVPWALAALAAGIAGLLFYLLVRSSLTYRCAGDKQSYLGGFRYLEDARKVLAGDFAGLPEERQIKVGQPPKTARDYLCTSGKDPLWIWTKASIDLAGWGLMTAYLVFMLLIVGGLGALAIELREAEVEVRQTGQETVVTVPAVLLFDFGSSDIAPGGEAYLAGIAQMIREAKAGQVRILGHTDGVGEEAYNRELSSRRAAAVRAWLAAQSGLDRFAYEVSGLGETKPRFPETDAAGRDLPEARRANRRVEIIFADPP